MATTFPTDFVYFFFLNVHDSQRLLVTAILDFFFFLLTKTSVLRGDLGSSGPVSNKLIRSVECCGVSF
jgi:hypothetical protein